MRQVPLERDINIAINGCYKWMFWVRNLHQERAIYANVDYSALEALASLI